MKKCYEVTTDIIATVRLQVNAESYEEAQDYIHNELDYGELMSLLKTHGYIAEVHTEETEDDEMPPTEYSEYALNAD